MKSESQRFYPKWLDPYLMLPKAQIIEFRSGKIDMIIYPCSKICFQSLPLKAIQVPYVMQMKINWTIYA